MFKQIFQHRSHRNRPGEGGWQLYDQTNFKLNTFPISVQFFMRIFFFTFLNFKHSASATIYFTTFLVFFEHGFVTDTSSTRRLSVGHDDSGIHSAYVLTFK